MTPETSALLITIGAVLGIVAKRVPWVNNNAIPFIILAFQYVAAVLNGAGVLPDLSNAWSNGDVQFLQVGWVASVFNPFKVAFVNTAINVFLHQVQKAARRLPWQYVTSGSVAKKK